MGRYVNSNRLVFTIGNWESRRANLYFSKHLCYMPCLVLS